MTPGGHLRDWWLLLRLHRRAGIWLLLWPTLWALWLAATEPPPLSLVLGFAAGTVLLRSFACVADDLFDHLRHPGAERSRDRPLAQGRISSGQALALLAVLGALLLALLARLDRQALLLALPGLALAGILLLAGRFFGLPPVQWSLACTCSVPMACAASRQSMPWIEAALLVAASCCWIIAYENFYLLSSRAIESRQSAGRRLFAGHRRLLVILLQAAALVLLGVIGLRTQRGPAYYAGLALAAGVALLQVILAGRGGRDAQYRAFLYSSGFGAVVFAGLAADIALESYAADQSVAAATSGAAGLLTANSCEEALPEGYGYCVQRNLSYTPEGWPLAQKLDLYTPRRFATAPVVILVYGGDWSFGSRHSMEIAALALVRRGYVVLNVSHRVAPVFRFPAQLRDLQEAVRWIQRRAAELHADPRRLGVWGYSSGAQVAAMLALIAPDDAWGAADVRVQALVTDGLPSDLTRLDDPVLPQLLGATAAENPALYRHASPLYQVTPRAPPTFLYSGQDDSDVPLQQSLWMRDALRGAGVPVQLKVLPGAGHSRMSGDAIGDALSFLDGVLKP